MVDLSHLPLGKQPPKHDARTLLFGAYVKPEKLPTAPKTEQWSHKLSHLPMLDNDVIGDCTIAGAMHLMRTVSANAGTPLDFTNEQAVEAYSRICGYDPKQTDIGGYNPTDQGGVMLDVLSAWWKEGIGGHKIVAFAKIDHSNLTEIRQAIAIFGGLYCGFDLPLCAQAQTVWTPMAGARGRRGGWGGHCVAIEDYLNPTGELSDRFTCLTWASRKDMTPGFAQSYLDEAYVVVTQDFIDQHGKTPGGFDLKTLLKDVDIIRKNRGGARRAPAAEPKQGREK